MSVLGGVSPLLIPNPFLPDNVRRVPFFEVGTSNFAFGFLVGWLLSPGPRRVPALA